eukprot:403364735
MLDESNAFMPDDPTGGAELMFMKTGHYNGDEDLEDIQNLLNILFEKQRVPQEDQNILVTVESHNQIVVNPSQIASQSQQIFTTADKLQSHLQENANQGINYNLIQTSFPQTHNDFGEHHKPLFNFLYDKLAEAHNKAMPEFLKQKSPDKLREQGTTDDIFKLNPESEIIYQTQYITSDKALDDNIKKNFPITAAEMQNNFRGDDKIQKAGEQLQNKDSSLLGGPIVDLHPTIDIKPDLINHYNDYRNPFPFIAGAHTPSTVEIERTIKVTNLTPSTKLFNEEQTQASHFNDLINPFPLSSNTQTALQSEYRSPEIGGVVVEEKDLSPQELLHYSTVKAPPLVDRVKTAVDEIVHHPSEVFGDKQHKEKWNESQMDKLETEKLKQFQGSSERHWWQADPEQEDRGWLGNAINKVKELVSPAHKEQDLTSQIDQQKQRMQNISKNVSDTLKQGEVSAPQSKSITGNPTLDDVEDLFIFNGT